MIGLWSDRIEGSMEEVDRNCRSAWDKNKQSSLEHLLCGIEKCVCGLSVSHASRIKSSCNRRLMRFNAL